MKKDNLFFSLCLSILISASTFASLPGEGGLELIDFTVIQNLNKIDIKWSTSAIKTGGPYFCIEKSKDGKNYTKVVDLPAVDGAYSYSDYFENDYQPYPGVSYYRIKQVDPVGNFRYSQIVTLKISEETKIDAYEAVSNVDGESLLKEIKAEDTEVLLIVRDKNGDDYYSKATISSDDNKTSTLNLSAPVTSGTYQVIGSSSEKLNSQNVFVK